MNKVSLRKITAGFLGLGLLALALPALADTPISAVGLTRVGVVGTTQTGNLGPVASVHCSLTRVQPGTTTAALAECRLVDVGGNWRLNATVLNAGASVVCEARCYQ